MDEGRAVIEKLFDVAEGRFIVPLVLIAAGVALIRAVFSMRRSVSADRKDFLELWSRAAERDDAWIEVAVRHLFGEYLPASLIRSLLTSSQAGRALCEVSAAWPLLDMDDETKQLHWKLERHSSARRRRNEVRVLNLSYAALAGSALVCIWLGSAGQFGALVRFNCWAYAFLSLCGAAFCVMRSDQLESAGKAVPRWLGLQ
ncbi:hypothetical protein [Lysobacter sp. GCM10012299]|uniref:hypothetical protein n=1 Tax=Lysobacter sp. GCM10012299 TaxID=3317333 RepID=UPI003614D4BC